VSIMVAWMNSIPNGKQLESYENHLSQRMANNNNRHIDTEECSEK
jgi:hypothetical protein